MSPFQSLPDEVRTKIYKEILHIDTDPDIFGNPPVFGANKFSILQVNRQIRSEALEVLLEAHFWCVFRIHHLPHEPAPRGEHESQYHFPQLQFLASEPCLSTLYRHQYLLINVGNPPGLEGFSPAETEKITVLVFPCNERRIDYFCLDLWRNSNRYLFLSVRLGVLPKNVQVIGRILIHSCTPVNGYQGAAFIAFDPDQGKLLEQRLSKKTRSWEENCDIVYHYYRPAEQALTDFTGKKPAHMYLERALHSLQMGIIVFNLFVNTIPIDSPFMMDQAKVRWLQQTEVNIKFRLAIVYQMCVESERDLDSRRLSTRSWVLIKNGLIATDCVIARTPRVHVKKTAIYQRGFFLWRQADYERSHSPPGCQACEWISRSIINRAAVDYYTASVLTKSFIESEYEGESDDRDMEGKFLDYLETSLSAIEEISGSTRKKTICHAGRLTTLVRQQPTEGEHSDADSDEEVMQQHTTHSPGGGVHPHEYFADLTS